MFETLKLFLNDLRGARPQKSYAFDDERLATAALLIHIANADGYVDPKETRRLHGLVEAHFQLAAKDARDLIAQAEKSEKEAIDLYQFTAILKRRLDEGQRRSIVALLWDMAFADGVAHEFEENLVWRVAELLGVSARERIALKQQAKAIEAERSLNDASKQAPSPKNPTLKNPWREPLHSERAPVSGGERS